MLSGKTEATKTLMELLEQSKTFKYSVKLIKFAQPLYDIQKLVYERIHKPEPIKDRKLLQYIGTNWGRTIDEDLWVNIWRIETRSHLNKQGLNTRMVVVCDDCRFANEAKQIIELGGQIIDVECDREVRQSRGQLINESHASENGIPYEYITGKISNNGTKSDLRDAIKERFGNEYYE